MDSTTNLDPTTLDQSALQNLLGGSAPSLIPESLITTLTVGFVVLNVLAVLFLIFYVVNLIRKWKVESAVLQMQKDLAQIKVQLAAPQPSGTQRPPVSPTAKNEVIAGTEPTPGDTQLS